MTSDEAKSTISALASASPANIAFAPHARDQMSARKLSFHDVRNVLIHASSCVASTEGVARWVLHGVDLDGEDTRVVCVIEGRVIVITVF